MVSLLYLFAIIVDLLAFALFGLMLVLSFVLMIVDFVGFT